MSDDREFKNLDEMNKFLRGDPRPEIDPVGRSIDEMGHEIERLRAVLQVIANDGCGMARIKHKKTLWCPDFYGDSDDWCWCCIARRALEGGGEDD